MSSSSSGTEVRQGGHACVPFETESEKRKAVLEFVHEGLTRGARCVYVGTAPEFEELRKDLESLGICSRRAVTREALVFRTNEEVYLTNGVFDPSDLIKRTDQYIDQALNDGFTGLRRTGQAATPTTEEVWRQTIAYEARINEHFARRPFWALCRYSRMTVSPERVCDLLKTHPVAVVRGELCDNPFYERPELALSDDGQARLNWQLRQMRVQNRTRRQLEGKTVSAVTAAAELAAQLHALRSSLVPQRDSE